MEKQLFYVPTRNNSPSAPTLQRKKPHKIGGVGETGFQHVELVNPQSPLPGWNVFLEFYFSCSRPFENLKNMLPFPCRYTSIYLLKRFYS